MPIVKTESGAWVEISEADYQWIAGRAQTSPTGRVSFTAAAVRRYRKLTQQEAVPAWMIRSQMQNEFYEFT